MPEVDPTNSTTAPRSFNSAATHSAGIACPPVPPPAISILLSGAGFDLSGSFTVLRYPVEDAHGGEAYQQARPTVAHEGKCHAGEREDHHGGPDVEGGLDGQHRGQADRDTARQYRRRGESYPKPRKRDKPEGGDHGDHPDQAKFLPDQGEDHIRADLGHVGSLPARPRTRTEEPTGFDGDH